MVKEDFYKKVKNMTLEEIASIFYPKEINVKESVASIKEIEDITFYTVNDLIEKYPFFTRYNLNKAIQSGGLPSCLVGKKRMFNKEEVEKWLEKETRPKIDKNKYDI